MRASVFIATSLDGFIARLDGSLDWLPGGDNELPDEDHGYEAFIATVDVLVMGRHTFETVLGFGTWPYGERRVIVLSSRPFVPPATVPPTVEVRSAAPADLMAALGAEGHRHAYVDGGQTIQRFLAAGLIERIIITRVPVLLGSGIPLFGPLAADIRLELHATRGFPSGLVQSDYLVRR